MFEKKKERSHVNTFHIHYKKELEDIKKRLSYSETKIESLEAKNSANQELRKLTEKHIEKLSEEIGEIKELFQVLNDEKKDLEIKVDKAVGIVNTSKPVELVKKFSSIEGKFSILQGKVSLNNSKLEMFNKDFKKFSKKLKVFKGESELIKLQNEVKSDLKTIYKVSDKVNLNASKIENHYIKIQEKINSALKISSDMKEVKKNFLEKQKEYDKLMDDISNINVVETNKKVLTLEKNLNQFTDVVIEKLNKKSKENNFIDKEEFLDMKKWVSLLIKINKMNLKVNNLKDNKE